MQKIPCIAVHASQRKDTPANRQKDAHSTSLSQLRVADLQFLEELSTFTNQILNAVARIGA